MQEYADREVAPEDAAAVSEHLASCRACRELYDHVREDKVMISNFLNQADLNENESAIPEFVPTAVSRKRFNLRILAVASAALITGIIFLVRPGRMPETEPVPAAEILLYEFYEGKDLNKMWHEKSQIIILHDENGYIIQPLITY